MKSDSPPTRPLATAPPPSYGTYFASNPNWPLIIPRSNSSSDILPVPPATRLPCFASAMKSSNVSTPWVFLPSVAIHTKNVSVISLANGVKSLKKSIPNSGWLTGVVRTLLRVMISVCSSPAFFLT